MTTSQGPEAGTEEKTAFVGDTALVDDLRNL